MLVLLYLLWRKKLTKQIKDYRYIYNFLSTLSTMFLYLLRSGEVVWSALQGLVEGISTVCGNLQAPKQPGGLGNNDVCTHKGIVLADIVSVCGDNTLGRECDRTRDGFFLVKIGGECTLNLSNGGS